MKFPKNRSHVFVVVRDDIKGQSILGVFASLEEADNYKGACEQEWKEKVGDYNTGSYLDVYFDVKLATFYG